MAAGVHSASQLALSSVLFTRVVLVCGLTRKLTKRTWARSGVWKHEQTCLWCTHPKQNVPLEHREGGASHGYVGQVGGATPRLDDDVVNPLLSLTCAVVAPLCQRCLRGGRGGSLVDRSLRRMCFPFAAAVALPTLTSQNVRLKGDLVAGLGHVALFSLFSSVRLSIGGFLQRFSSFVATVTERGTKELRSLRDTASAGQCARGRHGR